MSKSRNRKPRNDLHRLISSMSGHEKRFLKLSSRQAGEKKYLALFDAIATQQEYDEGRIKEEFKGESFVRHLPAAKNHLYNLILKSLRDYHTTVDRKIADLQHNAFILTNKGLHHLAKRELKKGGDLAEKIGHFTAAAEIEASQWNIMMDHAESIEEFEQKGTRALTRATEHLESRIVLLTLVKLNAQISVHNAKSPTSSNTYREFYQTLLQHPGLANDVNYAPLNLAAYYHLVRGSCYQYLKEFEKAWKEKKALVRISAEMLTLNSDMLKNYLSAVQNYANAAMGLRKSKALKALVEEIRALSTTIKLSVKQEGLLFGKAALIELQRLLLIHKKETQEKIPAWVADTVDSYGKHLRNVARFHICFIASVLLSLRCNYHDLLEWSTRGLSHIPKDSYNERLFDLRLMRGIALYELGKTDNLESELRSLKRAYNMTDLLPYQQAGLQALTRMQGATSHREAGRIAREVLEEHIDMRKSDALQQQNPVLYWLRTSREKLQKNRL